MAITITLERLSHVVDRHTPGGARNRNASTFFQEEDIAALINKADQIAPTSLPFGRRLRAADAGRPIGIDARTGQPSALYTVITDARDRLITAFPGVP